MENLFEFGTYLLIMEYEVDDLGLVCLNRDIKGTGGDLNEEGLCCDCIAMAIANIRK